MIFSQKAQYIHLLNPLFVCFDDNLFPFFTHVYLKLTITPACVRSPHQGFKAPLMPVLNFLCAGFNMYMMTLLSLTTWCLFLCWMIAGLSWWNRLEISCSNENKQILYHKSNTLICGSKGGKQNNILL